MENFEIDSQTKLIFGRGSENDIGSLIKNNGGRVILIHYGKKSVIKNGLLDRVRRSCERANITYFELGDVEANPKSDKVYDGIELCKEKNIDFILALGGCSVIDSAKAIAAGFYYDGDFWDLFLYSKKVYRALPIATILTTPAAGSESSPYTVISKNENGIFKKRSLKSKALYPQFSILNPEITISMPINETAYVAVDMIAHVLTRYFSNSKNVEVSDMLSEALLKTIINSMRKIKEDPENIDARSNLMWVGSLAHQDTYGAGKQQDWISHDLERALSSVFDTKHGLGLAVLLPAWLDFIKNHNIMRMAQFASHIFGIPFNFDNPILTANQGIDRFRDFLQDIGMPLDLGELGVTADDIPTILKNIDFKGKDTIGSYVKLDMVSCEVILSIALYYRR